jgi:hypothetical protein
MKNVKFGSLTDGMAANGELRLVRSGHQYIYDARPIL